VYPDCVEVRTRATEYTRHFPICISTMTQSLQAAAPPIASRASRDQLRCAVSCRVSTGFEGSVKRSARCGAVDRHARRTARACAYAYNPPRL
jgi:hypothetical protein